MQDDLDHLRVSDGDDIPGEHVKLLRCGWVKTRVVLKRFFVDRFHG
jgi:hypothetical protein